MKQILSICCILLIFPITVLPSPQQTPDPLIEAMVESITEEDVEDVLRTLVGFGSRYSSHSGCQKAVDYVADLFEEWGLDSVYTEKYKSNYAPNLIGVIKGSANTDSIFLLGAHIDATSNQAPNIAPGADDNGSGSTVTILSAKAMSKYRFRHTVRFVLFTGEENGIVGSGDYADKHKNDNIIATVINDMVGWTNSSNEDYQVEANTASKWIGNICDKAADDYVGLPTKVDPPSS